ncbi:MAG: hypothetical protein E6Q88_06755 [Lysobacteraceae bacterium]|nr:MAG: hypothetical protein E6Q88_06755 [Xanthomonadaceae bacterium]
MSLALKVAPVAVSFRSGPAALPRSTVATEAVGAGAAGGIGAGIGAGSVAAGGGAASSFFLQPTTATLAITARASAFKTRALERALRFMGTPWCEVR